MSSEKEDLSFQMGETHTLSDIIFLKVISPLTFFSSPHRSRNTFYKTMFSLIYTSFHEQTKFFKGIYSASYK